MCSHHLPHSFHLHERFTFHSQVIYKVNVQGDQIIKKKYLSHFYSYRYQQLILFGLIFSCAGDALLDYKNHSLFVFGMLAFAVAQIFYITAFGFKPLKVYIGIIAYVAGALGEWIKMF